MHKNILLPLSAAYGLLIGLLAVLDVESLGLIAAIGGVLLGFCWAGSGLLGRRRPES